jgi:hypothetical protein
MKYGGDSPYIHWGGSEAKRVPRGNSILRWEIIQVTFTRSGREGSSSPGEKLAGEKTPELAYD